MILDVAQVVLGLLALFLGGDALVRGATRLATSFGVSMVMVGLTVVAFGTSAPELLVAVTGALQGATGIAVGNILGSNIANIGLILGVSALMTPIVIQWRLVRREIPLLVVVTIAVYILALDGEISRLDGLLLILGFIAFVLYAYMLARHEQRAMEREIEEYVEEEGYAPAPPSSRGRDLLRLLAGIVLLALGADWTVAGATAIARAVGVSDLIIGITVVAVGTSLPEISATVVAAIRGENDIVGGNVIGSNVSNLLLILGTMALIQPTVIERSVLSVQFPIMVGFTLLLVPFALNRLLERWEGVVLLLAYLGFVGITVFA